MELDGIPDTLPILVEEIYTSINEQNSTGETLLKRSNSTDSVQTSPQIKSTTANSSPNIRQSKKKSFPSFRTHTSRNIDPIVALSNEPFVKLTSIRKFDQDNSFSLNYRSQSSRLTKQSRGQSLPDVSLQRSNSMSSSHVNQLDSPVIPKFLCSTTDKNEQEDEVFLTTDQDQVVDASTFGDSSTKSKVLRESYRRKANTKDRRTTPPKPLRSLSTSAATYHPQPNISHTQNSTENIDPLLLDGLTDDENQLNSIEKTTENDRIQTNSSINSQTIE